MMKSTDYWVVAIVLISAIVGLMRGFLREAIGIISLLLAIFIAWHFGSNLAPHLGGLLADPQVQPWAARAILFVIVLAIGSITGLFLGHFVRLSIFYVTDRFLGFAFGLLRGIAVVGVLVIIGQLLLMNADPWWRDSLLMPYAERVADVLRSLVGEAHHRITQV
jgi:membrane protein required for colicin V production